jgi:hypothetical protein
MAENSIRMSQLVGTFGPGAMLDLPDRSVLVLGLDHWEMHGKAAFQRIEEPRLQRLLHLRLKDDDRIVGDKPPDLRTPPINKGDPRAPSPAVRATVFPRWFACDTLPGDAPTVVGSRGFRTWTLLREPSTSGRTGRSARLHRSGLSAGARTAIYKTSTGAVSSIRT